MANRHRFGRQAVAGIVASWMALTCGAAQAADTLTKFRDSATATMGVRESSGVGGFP